MYVVVSYDIADDRRRAMVYKVLKDYGTRVQYSVFECRLNSSQLQGLLLKLARLINQQEDSINYYFLCGACIQRVIRDGRAFSPSDEQYFWF